jgi:iron(III) transport system permease protein
MTVESPAGAVPTLRVAIPFTFYRFVVIAVTAAVVLAPLSLVFYQSFLDAPFFQPAARLSLYAYRFVFADEDFWVAFGTTLLLASGMTLIAVPLGAGLAFLMVRTDVPGRNWLEPIILIPIFVSAVVLAFGYVVALGPVGILTTSMRELIGVAPWNLYSFPFLVAIAGLTHVPHVYLYAAAALRGLGSDVEEAARTAGAKPWRVALDVSLPMVLPAILFAAVLVFFLGFELFGLPLVLGDPQGVLVLSTYLFKLTNKLGVPSYQLMAVVVVAIVAITAPLVFVQRLLLREAQRYVSVRGKGVRLAPLRLGAWRWAAFAAIVLWFVFSVVLPLAGITLRSFVETWGEGIALSEVLTLDHYRELLDYPNVVRSMINTLGIGVIGGAAAVVFYTAIALAVHR